MVRLKRLGRCAMLALAAIAVHFAPFAVPAWAQSPSAAQSVTIRNSDELVIVVRRLIAAGQHDAARQIIKAWRPGDATYRYRVRYVEGLIQKAHGDYSAAIATFRGILAERPGFTAVRLDLTETLFLAEDDDAAKHQAELLIAAGLDEQIGGGLRSIVGAIDDRRPIRFRGFASVLPSTNLNSGTDRRCITIPGLPGCAIIDDASRRKSGIGVLLGGEVLFRQQFTRDVALIGSLGATGRFYPSIERGDLALSGSAGFEKRWARGQAAVSLVAEHDYVDMRAAFTGLGVRVEGSRYVGRTSRVYGSVTVGLRDYASGSRQDGWRVAFSGFYDYMMEPARFVRVLGGLTVERTNSPVFSYTEWSAGLGYHTELPMGLTVYTQGLYAQRDYDAPYVAFGVRHDTRIEAQALVTKRDWNIAGFAPQLSYSFVDNQSNVPFYDYTSHALDLRLVKQF